MPRRKEGTPGEGSLSGEAFLAAAKEEQARQRKRENDLKKVEERIEVLETREKEIDETLLLPEVCTNVARCVELSKEKTVSLRNWPDYTKNGKNLPEVLPFLLCFQGFPDFSDKFLAV